MFTDDAKAVIALTTRLGSSRRPSLSPGKWHRLATVLSDKGLRPADVFDRNRSAAGLFGAPPDVAEAVEALVADGAAAVVEADELGRRGIWVLTIVDPDYPTRLRERLKSNAPPVLFGVGNRNLFAQSGIGVVGSREVDERGAEVAKQAANEAVRLGRPVVSGGARGIDQLAMNAAYQAGGSVVGVIADSLLARIRNSDILAALDAGQTCLITQQSPASGFTPASAMARNKLIYALSAVTLVVASSEDSGGTWAGATEALRAKNGVVAVWRGAGEGAGNEALSRLGAVPIKGTHELGALLVVQPEPNSEQLSLY